MNTQTENPSFHFRWKFGSLMLKIMQCTDVTELKQQRCDLPPKRCNNRRLYTPPQSKYALCVCVDLDLDLDFGSFWFMVYFFHHDSRRVVLRLHSHSNWAHMLSFALWFRASAARSTSSWYWTWDCRRFQCLLHCDWEKGDVSVGRLFLKSSTLRVSFSSLHVVFTIDHFSWKHSVSFISLSNVTCSWGCVLDQTQQGFSSFDECRPATVWNELKWSSSKGRTDMRTVGLHSVFCSFNTKKSSELNWNPKQLSVWIQSEFICRKHVEKTEECRHEGFSLFWMLIIRFTWCSCWSAGCFVLQWLCKVVTDFLWCGYLTAGTVLFITSV